MSLAVPVPAVGFPGGITFSEDLLETLEVRAEDTAPFDPKSFEQWVDADADGCDTASEVLIAASHPSMIVVEPPCTILFGNWNSPYDRVFASDPAEMTVDHMVPLEEAWQSGAWAWTAEQRRDFANDLRYPQTSLVAVTTAVAREKGSKDPAQWQPPGSGVLCGYADLWIFVKSRWNLSVDPAEYDALMKMLSNNCPKGTGVPERGLTPGRGPAAIIGQVYTPETASSLLTVEAYAADGSVAGRTTVDRDSSYELTGLAPGTYRIKVLGGTSGALDQWYSTQGLALDAEPTPLQVSAGEVIPSIDIGLTKPRLFTDIPPEHPEFNMITWAAVSGYITGYADGTFRPETTVDRGSLSGILYRYAGSPPVPKDAPTFSDVPVGTENREAIRWIAATGIDTGYPDSTFRPEQEITRRTLAVFLHRLAGRPPIPPDAEIYSSYTDIQPGVPNYEELAWLASTFVIVGNPDGSFGPDQLIERGRMPRALFFYRFSFNFPVIGTSTAFTDVPAGSQFAGEISDMRAKGVVTGWNDGTFRPLEPVHRDAVAAFMYRLQGHPAATLPPESPFSDLGTDHPFYPDISWLAGQKITTGWPDKTYRPLAPVTREAMAAFLYRLAGSPAFTPPTQSPFTDLTTESQFYKEITWLAQTGITTGWPDHTYRPYEPVHRDAMAAFLYRFDNKH